MKGIWLSGEALRAVWSQLLYSEEPFAEWVWWETQNLPWGAVVVEEKGTPVAAIPLAQRQIGPFHLYRQPLSIPHLPVLLREPLPSKPSERYRIIGHILSGFGAWARRKHLSYIAGSLSRTWSYLPPLSSFEVRGHGSFVLYPGELSPSRELLRKVRQASNLPLRLLSPLEGFEWWASHRPAGVSIKLVQQLRPLMKLRENWHVVGVGEPLQAIGLFLIGRQRVWYMAGAHKGQGQAGTRLLYEVITWAHEKGWEFDFQGSVIPSIERFFRQFGGRWERRYYISAWRIW